MTIKDIAKQCSVSVSTVSRVLNDRPAYTEQKQQQNTGSGSGTYAGNKNSYESGKSSGNSTVKAPAGGKTGFGGAGVRGGAS